jgi:hypothetical protein
MIIQKNYHSLGEHEWVAGILLSDRVKKLKNVIKQVLLRLARLIRERHALIN